MKKKDKPDFLKETRLCGTEDPLKDIGSITNTPEIPVELIKTLSSMATTLGGRAEYIPPNISSHAYMPVKELRDVNIEMESKLNTIISKIDTLNEKPDVLKVLLDLGMSLTVLEKAGMETACLTFEGVNTYIKLTIEQYVALKACGVPDLI